MLYSGLHTHYFVSKVFFHKIFYKKYFIKNIFSHNIFSHNIFSHNIFSHNFFHKKKNQKNYNTVHPTPLGPVHRGYSIWFNQIAIFVILLLYIYTIITFHTK